MPLCFMIDRTLLPLSCGIYENCLMFFVEVQKTASTLGTPKTGVLIFLSMPHQKVNIYTKCKKTFYTPLTLCSYVLYLCPCRYDGGENKPTRRTAQGKYGLALFLNPDSPN